MNPVTYPKAMQELPNQLCVAERDHLQRHTHSALRTKQRAHAAASETSTADAVRRGGGVQE